MLWARERMQGVWRGGVWLAWAAVMLLGLDEAVTTILGPSVSAVSARAFLRALTHRFARVTPPVHPASRAGESGVQALRRAQHRACDPLDHANNAREDRRDEEVRGRDLDAVCTWGPRLVSMGAWTGRLRSDLAHPAAGRRSAFRSWAQRPEGQCRCSSAVEYVIVSWAAPHPEAICQRTQREGGDASRNPAATYGTPSRTADPLRTSQLTANEPTAGPWKRPQRTSVGPA